MLVSSWGFNIIYLHFFPSLLFDKCASLINRCATIKHLKLKVNIRHNEMASFLICYLKSPFYSFNFESKIIYIEMAQFRLQILSISTVNFEISAYTRAGRRIQVYVHFFQQCSA